MDSLTGVASELVLRVAMSAHRSTPVNRNEPGELLGLTLSGHSLDYEFWQTNTETQRLWYRFNESLGTRPRFAWAHNVSRTAASSALAFAQQNFVRRTEFLEVKDV